MTNSFTYEPPKQTQSITWTDELSALVEGDTFTLTASAQSSITYTSSDTSVATVEGNTLTLVAEGSATIHAYAEETDIYQSATASLTASVQSAGVYYTIQTYRGLLPDGSVGEHPKVLTEILGWRF